MTVKLGQSKITKGLRVYAVGDIHGCLVELNAMLNLISSDLSQHPVDDYRVIFLGDYQDRGPQSKGVVALLMSLVSTNPRFLCLRGNHDIALPQFVYNPARSGPNFFSNGGNTTLLSYGVRMDPGPMEVDQVRLIQGFSKAIVNGAHLKFLTSLPYSMVVGDYFFCHAGVRPGVALDKQSEEDLVWIRKPFLDHKKLYNKVIVHGHTALEKVDVQKNRINIDTRCYATGVLSCVVLEGKVYRFLQTQRRGQNT